MRLTDDDKTLIAELFVLAVDAHENCRQSDWSAHIDLLERLAAEPKPPENTVAVKVFCAAWQEPGQRGPFYMANDVGKDVHRYMEENETAWCPVHTATIYVPIARPPEGSDLGPVEVED